jgi:hypothetical protein
LIKVFKVGKGYYKDGLDYLRELRVVKMELTTCEDPYYLH